MLITEISSTLNQFLGKYRMSSKIEFEILLRRNFDLTAGKQTDCIEAKNNRNRMDLLWDNLSLTEQNYLLELSQRLYRLHHKGKIQC